MDSGHVSWPNSPTTDEDGLNVFGKPSAEAEQNSFNGKRGWCLSTGMEEFHLAKHRRYKDTLEPDAIR